MEKKQIKTYLDYLPFFALVISAFVLLWTIATTDIVLVWKHYLGLVMLPIIVYLFYKRHLFGVLALAFTLFMGLLGLISYSPAITITSFGFGNNQDWSIDVIRFQPIFLLWLFIHFLISGRYYTGIASKKYWQEVKEGVR